MITQITGKGSEIVDVEKAVQGVILTNIRKDSTIKIDRISQNDGDSNRFPTLTVEEYVQLFLEVYSRDIVLVQGDANSYQQVYIPFTIGGCLDLNEDDLYRMTLSNLNNRTIDVLEFDSSYNTSSFIQFQRIDIKKSLAEEEIDIADAMFLFFPNGSPLKMEHRVSGFKPNTVRKVTILPHQLSYHNKLNRLVSVDENGMSQYGTELESYPVAKLRSMTIHKTEGEEFVFYKLKY